MRGEAGDVTRSVDAIRRTRRTVAGFIARGLAWKQAASTSVSRAAHHAAVTASFDRLRSPRDVADEVRPFKWVTCAATCVSA